MSEKLIRIRVRGNCSACPFLAKWDNVHSQHALDWHCEQMKSQEEPLGKKIKGFIEGGCDEPEGFPVWCPGGDA